MSTLRRITTALSLLLLSAPAWPQFRPEEMKAAQRDPKRYTIDETTIRIARVRPVAAPSTPAIPSPGAGGGLGTVLPVLDEIVNIGSKIWKIIDDNKPVVDVKTQYATALPKGSSGWQDIGGWHTPEGAVYELTAKNGFGMNVINVRYQVLRTYGGSYNGNGKYLTAVTVQPLLVEVGWGYHFSLESSVPDTSIVNVGTSSDPVAGMMAVLSWRISTPLKDSQGQSLYFLQGDGVLKEVGGPFDSRSLAQARAKVDAAEETPAGFE